MESLLGKIENGLAPIYKGLPDLPKNGREWLVKAAPVLAVIVGVVQLLMAWSLWHVAHVNNSIVNLANQTYGTNLVASTGTGLFYWLSFGVLIIEALILLAAYSGLRNKQKKGWNMIFLATLVNALYGVLVVFDNTYGGVGRFVFTIIGTAIALYFVFEIRSYYGKTGRKKA